MPIYEIEQYEIHTQRYRVQAQNEVEAIVKLFDGQAQAVDNSLVFIGVADDYGLPVDEARDLAETLRKAGVPFDDDVIPAIRSLEEVE